MVNEIMFRLREAVEGTLPARALFWPIVGSLIWAVFSKSEPQA